MKDTLQKFVRLKTKQLSLFEKIWLLVPVAIWFSYRPLMRFGKNETMYFEQSITLVVLVLLALAALPKIWQEKRHLIRNKAVLLAGAFVLMRGVSILWTPNQTRGVLTFCVIGALYLVFLGSVATADRLKKLIPALYSVLIGSALVMCVLAIFQLLAGIWLSPSVTLLCSGCTAPQFGFARPNLFAIEPQFFGSMLVAPALTLFYKFLQKKHSQHVLPSLFVIVMTLFLTLSRGAIFAFGVGVVIVLLLQARSFKSLLKPLGVLGASFAACLLLQGTVAAANPNLNTTFFGAIRTSINQLTLGQVNLEPNSQSTDGSTKSSPKGSGVISKEASETKPQTAAYFEGYVEESTNVRLHLSRLSLTSWSENLGRIIFGVGLGGSGMVLRQEFPNQVNNREIVQNEFVETLLENGLIGLALFVTVIISLLARLRNNKWAWAIVAAFIVQWNFFSGYPNALHIYLILIIIYVLSGVDKTRVSSSRA